MTRGRSYAGSTICTTSSLVVASPCGSVHSSNSQVYKRPPQTPDLSCGMESLSESRPVLSDGMRFCQSDTQPIAIVVGIQQRPTMIELLVMFRIAMRWTS